MKRTPLKRKTRLRPMSTKRKMEALIYSQKRKMFLEDHPICQAHEAICGWLYENDHRAWLLSPFRVHAVSTDVHHVKGRIGANYLDESNWLAVSRWSHRWIHDNPKVARKLGLLQ